MATVSDVAAQSSFTGIHTTFGTDSRSGLDALDDLTDYADAAVLAITTALNAFSPDYTDIDAISTTSPLIGDGGTNVLYDTVLDELQSKEYGISATAEDLLFERMREREARLLSAALDGASRMFSSGGFTQPTGGAVAVTERLNAEFRDKVVSANREATIKHEDMYVEARKAAVLNAISTEKLSYETAKLAAERFIVVLSAKMADLKAVLETQATLATAAMSGMNVNLGLSISGSANVGGSETVSESTDKSTNVIRKSESRTWDETKGVTTHSDDESYIDYHYTNET